MLKKYFFYIALSFTLFNSAVAGYDKNLAGTISGVYSYSNGLVLFAMSNQPNSHPSCNHVLFALATDLPEAAVNRMYSRLLTAYTTQTVVNIGYDSQGNCGNSYIRVHRVG